MKSQFGWLCACMLIASLSRVPPARAQARLNVVASLSDFGAIAEAVGGDKVRVTTLASGLQDPHFVDPKPSYVVKLRDADLLLVNGLELEIGWLPRLIEGARNGRIKPGSAGYIDCSQGIPVLEVPSGEVTRAQGDVHARGNPHYTTDPLNGKIVATTIAAAFARARPESATYFETRRKAFEASIDRMVFGQALVDLVGGSKLDRLARSGELPAFLASESAGGAPLANKLGGLLGKLRPLAGKNFVFYHKSYSYLCARFGLNVVDYIEQKPGIQPGPAHLVEVVASMQREHVRILGKHPFEDEKIAKLVADKAHAQVVVLPLLVGGLKGADNYLALFDVVSDALLKASAP